MVCLFNINLDNQMDKQDNLQPEQDDDEFYEDDSRLAI